MERSNDEHIAAWSQHRWYPALVRLHSQLSRVIPGYTVIGIKDRYGSLDFIYVMPAEIDDPEFHRGLAEDLITAARLRCEQIDVGWERDPEDLGAPRWALEAEYAEEEL